MAAAPQNQNFGTGFLKFFNGFLVPFIFVACGALEKSISYIYTFPSSEAEFYLRCLGIDPWSKSNVCACLAPLLNACPKFTYTCESQQNRMITEFNYNLALSVHGTACWGCLLAGLYQTSFWLAAHEIHCPGSPVLAPWINLNCRINILSPLKPLNPLKLAPKIHFKWV